MMPGKRVAPPCRVPGRGAGVGRRSAIAAIAAIVAGAAEADCSPAAIAGRTERELIALCAEFHRLDHQYSEALLRADRWPVTDPAGASAAEEFSDSLSDLQDQVMRAIAARRARTVASARAKAKAVTRYFEDALEKERASDRMLWSLVRDVAAGLSS